MQRRIATWIRGIGRIAPGPNWLSLAIVHVTHFGQVWHGSGIKKGIGGYTMINLIRRILGNTEPVPEPVFTYTVIDGGKVVKGMGTRSQVFERARQYGWWGIALKCEALGI